MIPVRTIKLSKPTKIEILFILVILTIFPIYILTNIYYIQDISFKSINIVYEFSILLSIVFSVILLLQLVFKRNYLKIVFGCHTIFTRSCRLTYKYLSICARCTGILIGIIVGPLIFEVVTFSPLYLLILGIPLIIDGTIQLKTKYESNNIKRLLTGIMFAPSFIIIFSYSSLLMFSLSNWIINIFI